MRVHYPSVLESTEVGYIPDSVLIEFGGRNITEPNEDWDVRPDIADHLPALDLPCARVTVLSPNRTFWEKATLMHVECHRKQFRVGAERLSRHWYDLAMLADHAIGADALSDRDLLRDVIKHKKAFYDASYANYDACLTAQFRLIPTDTAVLAALREDFSRMLDAGMFIGERPSFDAILERLAALEVSFNR